MNTYEVIILSLSLLFVLATAASLVKWNAWWIRSNDFPRLQISTALIILIIAGLVFYSFSEIWHFIITGLIIISLVYQLRKIFQYTVLGRKQVLYYKGHDADSSVSLIVSNVLQSNRKAEKLIARVRKMDPDLLLILEANDWWAGQLEVIEEKYPYNIKKPQDNLYGMILYSKLELKNSKINFLLKKDVPSFEADLKLRSGDLVRIYCLHPKPPFPLESFSSLNRDAELLLVGKKIKKEKKPVLIFGDLNDVAWSGTTRLFQKISKLLDPRIGRGFFNTFHAKYPLIRWPLDHIFHSSHFMLIRIKRLKHIGSDHFPIYFHLYMDPSAKKFHDEPQADGQEKQRATGKIKEGDPR
jgi:endonuclease/exonuclease/phosphatase (EEP) superfamily protein YafD